MHDTRHDIIGGGGDERRDAEESSSVASDEDVRIRLGLGAASRAHDGPDGNRLRLEGSNPPPTETNSNRQRGIIGRDQRAWASGAGPLESDDEYDDDLRSNLVSSALRANANRLDAESSSNPSPPLASYNHRPSQANQNTRHVIGGVSRAANNFGRVSSSDEDSNEEVESNNTSHEENMIASDANFRRQQESNLNLRALGIRSGNSGQINSNQQNRQNLFNRIISSHMQRE